MNDLSIIFILLKIECCNVILLYVVLFLKVFCDIKFYDICVLFGDVFWNGILILRDFEVSKKIFKEK